MNAIIMIEVVVGIVVLAAAVRFAVRDARQRSAAVEPEVEPAETTHVPAGGTAPQAEQETEQEASQKAEQEASQKAEQEARAEQQASQVEPVGSTETN
jgi:hypothetical protein